MERQEEFAAYVGPKAAVYGEVFERFTRDGVPRFAFSWNWPAFFFGVWWYLYRKMYLWALVDFAVSVAFGWTFFVPLVWAIARAVTGNYLYFLQADRAVREQRQRPAGGGIVVEPGAGAAGEPIAVPAEIAQLAREGGVHRWVVWAAVAGIALLLILSSLFFGLLWQMIPAIRHHWPPPPGIPV